MGGPQAKEAPGQSDWLDLEGLCNYLPGNPAKQTIYANISTIPHKKFGKRLAFKKSEIDAWLESKSQKTVSEIEAEAESYLKNKKGLINGK